MKKIIFTIFCLSISFISFSQIRNKSKVDFVAYWLKNDQYNFEILKITEYSKDNVKHAKDTLKYKTTFNVIDSTSNNYTIKWSVNNNYLDKNNSNLTNENLDIIYKTNELGQFQEVINWREIAQKMDESFNQILRNSVTKSVEEQKKQIEIISNYKKMFSSKEGVENLVNKEIKLFHYPFGVEFPTNKPIEYQEDIDNPFNDKIIKSSAKIYFEKIDFENETCILIKENIINPKETKLFLTDLFRDLKFNDSEFNDFMEKSKISLNEKIKMNYYYYPGLPIEIIYIKESEFNILNSLQINTEITKIKLLKP